MLVTGTRASPPPPEDPTITTSWIRKVEGNRVTTKRGNVYILGTPSKDYLALLKAYNREYDPQNPVFIPPPPEGYSVGKGWKLEE